MSPLVSDEYYLRLNVKFCINIWPNLALTLETGPGDDRLVLHVMYTRCTIPTEVSGNKYFIQAFFFF